MKLSNRNLRLIILFSTVFGVFFYSSTNPFAQSKALARTSHINDFAGVIKDETKQRLDTILQNVQLKSGVQFDVALVQTTDGRDISDYSLELARDWKVGTRTTDKKSLLLVVSITDKSAFTRFSRTIQDDLPEGMLAEMGQRLRTLLATEQFDLGLSDAVEFFVANLGKRMAFTLDDVAQNPSQPESQPPEKTSAPSEQPAAASATDLATGNETRKRQVTEEPVKISASATARTNVRKQAAPKINTAEDDADESEEVELTLTLPLEERIVKLKEFIEKLPNSKSKPRAYELLVSAHATLGDKQLKGGDVSSGTEHLRLAVKEAPDDVSDQLFSGVIAQVPLNLYLRNERVAAFDTAQQIETRFGTTAPRLLGIAQFYLKIEQGDEAARLAEKAISLTPDSAEAHYIHGLGLHLSLRLDEAMAEYKKAMELDPNLKTARRSLADLSRASGKAEDALAYYREQVTADPKDKLARTGLVLSLLELGKTEEGGKELDAALQDDPKNVSLLAGTAYWYAAHNDTGRALDLANRAVEVEPRYTWSQIALARALLGEKKPLAAERALRYVRLYGKFPTLDYELATVLSSTGLYDEAAEMLAQSFTLKENEIEARLGGRTPAHADNFIDLLGPERRGSLFQSTPADTAANSRMLKSLLAFHAAASSENVDEKILTVTGKDFAAGDDAMRVYRQLYVAGRLLRLGKGLDTVIELSEQAKGAVDDGLQTPAVTVAVQAEELREIRARAIASGNTPDIAEAPHNVLGNLLRGRIEDHTGWALFNQDKPTDAVDHLKRASNVLLEGTPSWRTAVWHLGAALEQTGNKEEALNYYIKSYVTGEHDPVRRGLIEQLYVKVNGSTAGLEERIGAAASSQTTQPTVSTDSPPATSTETASNSTPQPSPVSEPAATPVSSPETVVTKTEPPATKKEASTETVTPYPESTPTPAPRSTRGAEPSLADLPPQPPRTRATLKINGQVKDAEGKGIANAVVVMISPKGSVIATTTDSEGKYSFVVMASEKPVRILPSKEGYVFAPVDKTIVIFSEDKKGIDFVGTPPPSP
jgi:tetratricopeptide (TPR) repeat protein/uncharacterized membrane protein YgcG